MKKLFLFLPLLALSLPEAAGSVTQYKTNSYNNTGVAISLSDATGTVYRAGEAVRFTARANSDAYLLVFDIDTDGFVHLLYPRDARSLRKFAAGETLTIPAQSDESLLVTGETGMEFVFAIAVPDRDAISEREIDWFLHDETQPAGERLRVKGDPFLSANRMAARLVRGITYANNVSLAYTYFFVNEAVDYPRYLCEDCDKNDTDPYNPDQGWVATKALNQEDALSYPLWPAFQVAAHEDSEPTQLGVTRTEKQADGTTNVYVSYYPTWEGGYYYPARAYPYYGSGWSFAVGFDWGWGYPYYYGWDSWGWGYPYYYGGYYCRPYYGHYYPHHYGYGGYYSVAHRTIRPHSPSKYKYKSDVRGTSTVARGSRERTGYQVASQKGSSRGRYTPRSNYKGYQSYSKYKSGVRSVHTPRQSTYGKTAYKRGYSDTKSIYRPRAKDNYREGRTYTRTRSTVNKMFSRSGSSTTRSRTSTSYKGTTRSRGGYGSFSRGSFTKSRGSSHSFSGHSRARSSSGGRSKSRSR